MNINDVNNEKNMNLLLVWNSVHFMNKVIELRNFVHGFQGGAMSRSTIQHKYIQTLTTVCISTQYYIDIV